MQILQFVELAERLETLPVPFIKSIGRKPHVQQHMKTYIMGNTQQLLTSITGYAIYQVITQQAKKKPRKKMVTEDTHGCYTVWLPSCYSKTINQKQKLRY